jgi:hypothetical protein
MPILNVPSTMPYPPGFTGNPYTPNDISKFFDLNWPDHAGMLAQGYSAPGLGGLRGLGACGDCIDWDENNNCIATDTADCGGSTPDPLSSGSFNSIPTTGSGTDYTCSSVALSSMSAQDMLNCGYTTTLGGALSNPPLNTPVTPAQAGLTTAQTAQLIAAAGNSAVSLIRTAAGGPYTVAGTNLVYNPATGQITTAAAVNATATLSTGLASLSPYIPYIIAAIAAVVILPSLMGGKR